MFRGVVALLAVSSCIAFMPMQMKMDKPSPMEAGIKAVQKILVGGAAFTGLYSTPLIAPAHADGAVSSATVTRAAALYGPRVIALKGSAEKGDFAAIESELGAAKLFNSGAFAMNRPLQKKVQAAFADVEKAVKAKDAGALKSAWSTYFKTASLDKTTPFSKKDPGQAISSDFGYAVKNKNFFVE